MSKFKSFLLLNFLLALLVFVVIGAMQAYAFSDDFNDGDILDWSVVSGSFSISNINGFDGTNYTKSSSGEISKTGLSSSNTYFEVLMRSNTTVPCGTSSAQDYYQRFKYNQNSTAYLAVAMHAHHSYYSSCGYYFEFTGTTLSAVDYSPTQRYIIKITVLGNNINVNIRTYPDDTLVTDQTGSITTPIISSDRISLAAQTEVSFDNVVAQTYSPGSTPIIISWGNSITNNQNTTIYIP